MKKIVNILMVVLLMGSFSSCIEEQPVFPPYTAGGTALLSGVGGLFDLNDLPNSTYSFTIDVKHPDNVTISSVTIMKSLNGGTPVAHAEISSFPASITVTPADVVNGLGIGVDDLKLGDDIDFTLKVNTNNGTFSAQDNFDIKPACISDLAGMYSVVTSGEAGGGVGSYGTLDPVDVTVTEESPGTYSVDDISGGMYPGVWGGSPQEGTFSDVCNSLTINDFTDQWGDTFSGSGTVNADKTMTLNWSNTYGDNGESIYTPK